MLPMPVYITDTLGTQRIERDAGQEKNESKVLYPHIRLFEKEDRRRRRRLGGHCGAFDAAWSSSASPFEHESVYTARRLASGATSAMLIFYRQSGQNKHAGT